MSQHPKVGMHTAPSGYGVPDVYIDTLDSHEIPTFMKGGDATGGVYRVQQKLQDQLSTYGRIVTPHTAVYRTTTNDSLDYTLLPEDAAQKMWDYHYPRIPVELDTTLIWIEIINEPRFSIDWATDPYPPGWASLFTGWGDYVGWCCYYLGLLAISHDIKFCGPGFAAGNPDEGVWEQPGFLAYLELCENYPHHCGVAVHEYSLHPHSLWSKKDTTGSIVPCSESESGYRFIGRFLDIVSACEKHSVKVPQIFITEWGWDLWNIPPVNVALEQIIDTGRFYAQYPEVLGMGLWYLGTGWQGIHEKVYTLIDPLASPSMPLLGATINTVYDEPQPPPDPTDNLLFNGSFELGGYYPDGDGMTQVPNTYYLGYSDDSGTYQCTLPSSKIKKINGNDLIEAPASSSFIRVGEPIENPHDQNPWSRFQKVESKHEDGTTSPEYVLDGNKSWTALRKNVTFIFYVGHTITHPHQGIYKINLKIYPRLVKGYESDGSPIWGDDPQKRDGLIQVKMGNRILTDSPEVPDWLPLDPGSWNDIELEYEGENEQIFEVWVMCPFPLPENQVYFDQWSIQAMKTNDCPAITDVKTTSLWIPQYNQMTTQELTQAMDWAENGFPLPQGGKTSGNHMLCPSHVDALRIHTQGLPDSILGICYPHKIGTGVTMEWIEQNCPCALDNKQVVMLGEIEDFQFTNLPVT